MKLWKLFLILLNITLIEVLAAVILTGHIAQVYLNILYVMAGIAHLTLIIWIIIKFFRWLIVNN